MARPVSESEIDGETPRVDLEFCILEAERTRHPDIQGAAARARAELSRRDQQHWIDRFKSESKERVKTQEFQTALSDLQFKAQEKLMGLQLDVAKKQSAAANSAAQAAQRSAQAARLIAWATIALAIVTLILAEVSAIPHVRDWLNALAIAWE